MRRAGAWSLRTRELSRAIIRQDHSGERFAFAAGNEKAPENKCFQGRNAPGTGAYKTNITCIASLVADYGKTIIYLLAQRNELMI